MVTVQGLSSRKEDSVMLPKTREKAPCAIYAMKIKKSVKMIPQLSGSMIDTIEQTLMA